MAKTVALAVGDATEVSAEESNFVLLVGNVISKQYAHLINAMAAQGLLAKVLRIDRQESYTSRDAISTFVAAPQLAARDIDPDEFDKMMDVEVLKIEENLLSTALNGANLKDVRAIVFSVPEGDEREERWAWLNARFDFDVARYTVQKGDDGKFWLSGYGFGGSLPVSIAR